MRYRFPAAAFGVLLLACGAARAATTIEVTNVALAGGGTVRLTGPGIDRTVNDTALLLTTSTGLVLPAFCVDIYHDLTPGAVDVTYAQGPLLTDSSGMLSGTGAPLSPTQIGEIESLADYGSSLFGRNDPNLSLDLSGVQGAIWAIEYPSVTVAGNAAIDSAIAADETYAAANPALDALAFYDVAGAAQGQMMGSGPGPSGGGVTGVPEPATWWLLTLGVGGVGLGLRAGRARLGASTARRAA